MLINWEDAKRKQIDMKWKIIFEDNPSYLEISLEMEIERWIAVKAIFVSPVNPVHTLQVKFSLTKERNKAYMLKQNNWIYFSEQSQSLVIQLKLDLWI